MVSPLEGIKVLDLSEEIAGPFCSMQLADAGADVIKVEPPNGDWARSLGPKIGEDSALYLALNRNKKSVVIDINNKEGIKIVHEIAKQSDIFLENMQPGVSASLHLGYEDLRVINPNIIYCSISAFGERGPYASRVASELEVQGMAGYIQYLGEPGDAPVRLGADVASINTAMFAFVGILSALYNRNKSGVGQKVVVPMLGTLLCMGSNWLTAQSNPDRYGGNLLTGPYDHAETGYQTKDHPITLGITLGGVEKGKRLWEQICRKVGLEQLLDDPYFSKWGPRLLGIGKEAQEMKPILEKGFEKFSSEEMVDFICQIGGQAAAIHNYDMLFGEPLHPQVAATEMVQYIENKNGTKIKTLGIPWKFSKTPLKIKTAPPRLGEHTTEIIRDLGYTDEQISELRARQLII